MAHSQGTNMPQTSGDKNSDRLRWRECHDAPIATRIMKKEELRDFSSVLAASYKIDPKDVIYKFKRVRYEDPDYIASAQVNDPSVTAVNSKISMLGIGDDTKTAPYEIPEDYMFVTYYMLVNTIPSGTDMINVPGLTLDEKDTVVNPTSFWRPIFRFKMPFPADIKKRGDEIMREKK